VGKLAPSQRLRIFDNNLPGVLYIGNPTQVSDTVLLKRLLCTFRGSLDHNCINQEPGKMGSEGTMQAVVFKGKLQVAVEKRPIPKIQDPTDIIVKVRYTALCGR
jgi:hypothetical protein